MERSYYAIIPANVRYDEDLTANAKLLYGEITALANEKGYCWASNSYFAELYKVSTVSISRWISQLIRKGYIEAQMIYRKESREIQERRIYIASPIKKEDEDSKGDSEDSTEETKKTEGKEKPKSKDRAKDPVELLSKKYSKETINLALERASDAKNNGTKINNLYAYLNKLCQGIEEENKVLGSAKNNRNKTKFHNFIGRTENYTSDELESVARRKREQYIKSMMGGSLCSVGD